MDLVINQTDGYLFSGRDFLPQVQIRLTITTDQPSRKALIVELRILSGTYKRGCCKVILASRIGLPCAFFLGPRRPLVLPLVDPPARTYAMKIWIQCIEAYMPHESSGDSSNQPDGPMGSPRRLP